MNKIKTRQKKIAFYARNAFFTRTLIFNKITFLICYLPLILICFFSCNFDFSIPMTDCDFTSPEWTFMIYMAADNDLYKAATLDLQEILNSQFSEQITQIVVFLDTTNTITLANKEYSGTNLFCVKNTRIGENYLSTIPLSELQLGNENTKNVDSGDYYTLKQFVKYAKKSFPAKNYSLILWGHGTGYKCAQADATSAAITDNLGTGYKCAQGDAHIAGTTHLSPVAQADATFADATSADARLDASGADATTKGICVDSSSNSYISTIDLKNSLQGENITLLGFDACFSSIIEVAFELKKCVQFLAFSEGALNTNGWDYEYIFTQFSKTNLSHQSLSKILLEQYSSQYSTNDFSVIETTQIQQIANNFNDFTKVLASYIDSGQKQKLVFDSMFASVKNFIAPSFPTEMFIDIYDFAQFFYNTSLSDEISSSAQNLMQSLKVQSQNAQTQVLSNQNSQSQNSQSLASDNSIIHLAIYFLTVEQFNIPTVAFDNIYINDNKNGAKLDFALNCDGWTPTRNYQLLYDQISEAEKQNESLLNKLFFTIF